MQIMLFLSTAILTRFCYACSISVSFDTQHFMHNSKKHLLWLAVFSKYAVVGNY